MDINVTRLQQISEFLEVPLEEILYNEVEGQQDEYQQIKALIGEYDQKIFELREKLISLYEELHTICFS